MRTKLMKHKFKVNLNVLDNIWVKKTDTFFVFCDFLRHLFEL